MAYANSIVETKLDQSILRDSWFGSQEGWTGEPKQESRPTFEGKKPVVEKRGEYLGSEGGSSWIKKGKTIIGVVSAIAIACVIVSIVILVLVLTREPSGGGTSGSTASGDITVEGNLIVVGEAEFDQGLITPEISGPVLEEVETANLFHGGNKGLVSTDNVLKNLIGGGPVNINGALFSIGSNIEAKGIKNSTVWSISEQGVAKMKEVGATPGEDLVLAAAVSKAIVTNGDIEPNDQVSQRKIGKEGNRYGSIFSMIFDANVFKAPMNEDLVIKADATKSVVVDADMEPNDQTSQRKIGKESNRYGSIFSMIFDANVFKAPTNEDLVIKADATKSVVVDADMEPNDQASQRKIGRDGNRYAAVFSTLFDALSVQSPTGQDLTLKPAPTKSVVIDGDVLPNSTAGQRKIGRETDKFEEIHVSNVSTSTVASPADEDLVLNVTHPGSSSVVLNAKLLPGSDTPAEQRAIGSAGRRFATVYSDDVFATTVTADVMDVTTLSVSGQMEFPSGLLTSYIGELTEGQGITFNGDLIPANPDQYNIGGLYNRVFTIYANQLDVNDIIIRQAFEFPLGILTNSISETPESLNGISFKGTLYPSLDQTFDLGKIGSSFNTLYCESAFFGGDVHVSGKTFTDTVVVSTIESGGDEIELKGGTALVPPTEEPFSLGNPYRLFSHIYTHFLHASEDVSTNSLSSATGDIISVYGNILPTEGESFDIGSEDNDRRYANAYFVNVNASNKGVFSNGIQVTSLAPIVDENHVELASDLIPYEDGVIDLGSIYKRFGTIYTSDLNILNQLEFQDGLLTKSIGAVDDTDNTVLITGNFNPSINNSFNLGAESFRFKTAYAVDLDVSSIGKIQTVVTSFIDPVESSDGTISLSGVLVPLETDTFDLGSDEFRFKTVYTHNLDISEETVFQGGISTNNVSPISPSQTVSISGNLQPSIDNSFNLGSDPNRFSTVYTYDLDVTNQISFQGGILTNSIEPISGSNLFVSASIIPSLSDNFDIGSPYQRFQTVYVTSLDVSDQVVFQGGISTNSITPIDSSTVSISGTLQPSVDNSFDLGSESNRFTTIFTYDLDVTNQTSFQGGILTNSISPVSGGEIVTSGAFVPSLSDSIDIGSLYQRFRTIYASKLDVSEQIDFEDGIRTNSIGPITGDNIELQGGFIPSTTDSFDLGSIYQRFRTVYTHDLDVSNQIDFQGGILTNSIGPVNGNNIELAGSFVPSETDTFDLGSIYQRLRSIYTSDLNVSNDASFDGGILTDSLGSISGNNVVLKDGLIPSEDSNFDLGTMYNRFRTIYTSDLDVSNQIDFQGGILTNSIGPLIGNNIDLSGSFIPSETDIFDLGSLYQRFKSIYASELNISNEASFTGGILTDYIGPVAGSDVVIKNGGLVPSETDEVDLGNAYKRFRTVYTSNLDVSNQIDFEGGILTNSIGPISGNSIDLSGSFIPSETDTFDLGSLYQRFRSIYTSDLNVLNETSFEGGVLTNSIGPVDGSDVVIKDGGLIPSENSSFDLGSIYNRFRTVYTSDLDVSNQIDFQGGILTNSLGPTTGDSIELSGSFTPSETDTFDLGTVYNRFRTIYASDLNVSNQIDFEGGILTNSIGPISGSEIELSGSFVPFYTGTVDLGSAYKIFRDIYGTFLDISETSYLRGGLFTNHISRVEEPLISVSGSFVPTDEDPYDIGSEEERWNTVYASNLDVSNKGIFQDGILVGGTIGTIDGSGDMNISIQGNIVPNETETYSIGTVSERYLSVYTENLDVDQAVFHNGLVTDIITELTEDGGITFTGNLLTQTDNTYDIGTDTSRFNTVYTTTIDTKNIIVQETQVFPDGILTNYISPLASGTGNIGINGNLMPGESLEINIGSEDARIATAFFETIDTTEVLVASQTSFPMGIKTTTISEIGVQGVTLMTPAYIEDSSNEAIFSVDLSGKTGATTSLLLFSGGEQDIVFPTGNITLADTTSTQTLAGKTLTSPTINTTGNLNRNVAFSTSGKTDVTTSTLTFQGGAQTITFPGDASFTIATTGTSQTFTNKTLTSPIISAISNTGVLTLPTTTTTLVGRNTTDTLTNKTLTGPVMSTIVNTGTLTLPTSTDTLVARNTTDTLTNKTLTSPTINTTGSTTKNLTFNTSGKTDATTSSLSFSGGAQTITFPSGTFTVAHSISGVTLVSWRGIWGFGGTSPQLGNIYYSRSGDIVSIIVIAVFDTATTGSVINMVTPSIPEDYRPARDFYFLYLSRIGGTATSAKGICRTDGSITLYANIAGGNFPSIGSCGIFNDFSFSYPIN